MESFPETPRHHQNFIDCVLSRDTPAASAQSAQRAATICHMGGIAAKLGRALKFDPKTEQFADEEANTHLMRAVPQRWQLQPKA